MSAPLKIWVGVTQDYDSERTELFLNRGLALAWLQHHWHLERKDAARTYEYFSREGESEPDVPKVKAISESYGGFAEFSAGNTRYFIQERTIRATEDSTDE